VVALYIIGAIVGPDESSRKSTESIPSPPGASSSAGAQGACPEVAQGWISQLDMPSGTYVYVDARTRNNGLRAWAVQKDDGGTWATDVDPSTSPSSGGLIVPLNDQARQDSQLGVDLSDATIANLFPGAPPGNLSLCG
jgi:hypothetical protein